MAISKVGVLGAGLMGNGIAQVSAQAGYEVVLREVNEETGVLSAVRSWVDDAAVGPQQDILCRFYLMEAPPSSATGNRQRTGKAAPSEKRQHAWKALADALNQLTFAESRVLVEKADQRRAELQAQKAST